MSSWDPPGSCFTPKHERVLRLGNNSADCRLSSVCIYGRNTYRCMWSGLSSCADREAEPGLKAARMISQRKNLLLLCNISKKIASKEESRGLTMAAKQKK